MSDEVQNPGKEQAEVVSTSPGDVPAEEAAVEPAVQSKDPEQPESTDPLEAVKVSVEGLERELEESKAQMLRAQAEMQNIQRRARNDVEKAHKFGVERFVKEMLPVLDSLEKAIEACEVGEDSPAQVVSLKDGVELTLTMMVSALKKFEVEVVDPIGKAFDPQLHEAMSVLPQQDVEPNSVVTVLQKGYLLSGRVVRPAMVIVAKAP